MQANLEQLYGSVDNIDLWVGGLVEDHVDGASVGETFQNIIADQFERLRDADRFWYQNTFSGSALAEIESTTLADIIERNTDLTDLQDDVFFFSASVSGTVTTEDEGTGKVDQRNSRSNNNSNSSDAGQGVADQVVQLVSDGEVVAETTTDSDGNYSFDVQDGLRTGEYEIQLVSQVDEVATTIAVQEFAITTGDIHLEDIDFSISTDDGGDEGDRDDRKGSRSERDSGRNSRSGTPSNPGSDSRSNSDRSGRDDLAFGQPLRPDLVDPFFSGRDDINGNRRR